MVLMTSVYGRPPVVGPHSVYCMRVDDGSEDVAFHVLCVGWIVVRELVAISIGPLVEVCLSGRVVPFGFP